MNIYFSLHIHRMGSREPKHHFWQTFLLARHLRFHLFFVFLAKERITYFTWSGVNWIRKIFWFLFLFRFTPREPITGPKITISCEFSPFHVKLWCHMFSSMKMEEYMESKLRRNFWCLTTSLVVKNIVLGFLWTQRWAVSAVISLLSSVLVIWFMSKKSYSSN